MSPRRTVLPALWLLLASAAVQPVHAEVPQRPASTLRTELEGSRLVVPLALSYHQIVLEEQTENGGWRPLAVQYPRSLTREQKRSIAFALPAGASPRHLRVTGYRSPKFPDRITYAKKEFSRPESPPPGFTTPAPAPLDRLKPAPAKVEKEAEPAPADLWHQDGDRLIYISPQRGLQLWDLSDPASPFRLSSLRLPISARSLHPLPGEGAPLLLLAGPKNDGQGSALLIIRWQQDTPAILSHLDLPGHLTDSLLTGTRLDAASAQTLKAKARRSLLHQVDLADAHAPRLLKTQAFSGARPAFRLRQGRLMLQVREGGRKLLHELPLPDAAQSLAARQHTPPPAAFSLHGYEITPGAGLLTIQDSRHPQAAPLQVRLVWRVDRILPVGDCLLQVEDGTAATGRPFLRISPAHDPDHLLKELALPPGAILGLTNRGDLAMVAQWLPPQAASPATLRTWVLDIADPAATEVLETLDHPLPALGTGPAAPGNLKPHWPDAATLVWSLTAAADSRPWWTALPALPALSPNTEPPGLQITAPLAVLCPVEARHGRCTARPPVLLTARPGRLAHVSAVHSAAGLLYFSYDLASPPSAPAEDGENSPRLPLRPQPGLITSWLQVADFRQPAPVLRTPASIPGQLLGLVEADAQGAVLLTQTRLSLRADAAPVRVIQASAYDGVHASQLTEYFTATTAESAFLVEEGRLLLARQTAPAGVVTLGYHPVTGRLSQLSAWSLPQEPLLLHNAGGHLLASAPGMLEVASLEARSGRLSAQASYHTPDSLWLRVDRATATTAQDLWIPAGPYGVEFLQKQAPGEAP